MSNWKLSPDGLTASCVFPNGELRSRSVHAIDAAELAAALPADPVDLATPARAQRDNLIAAVAWRYERHARELRLGLVPTDDIAVLDIYIQSLADITTQAGFPESITWPVVP